MDEWYSIGGFNDPMSSLTHLVGTALFLVFSFFLLWSARRTRKTFWYSFQFAASTLLLLTMSFVYHMQVVGSITRDVMLRLDVAAIFILIASTFTVVHGILFTGWKRWGIISVLWLITVTGVTLRTIFFHSIPSILGDGIFLLMGWIGAYSAFLLWKEFGMRAVRPVMIGGLFYTIGAVINSANWPVVIDKVWGPHESFHLFVLAGIATHWAFAWSLADGSFLRQIERESGKSLGSGRAS